ncbi:hypothetical protein [Sphingosinicella sp. BN140058]|uniref:hypothetical protein n=1 Tax=Sphingosinicella sp. BN140058 TaxID=1892855 RepID=UPI0010128082|nr:hypothetical protein [Sphingosinicella sp. BN140058]QAY78922.1 hypothetical protein ETR14_22065 [Sphingosinicella sp. BN140058]
MATREDGRCGYDWNGAGVELEGIASLAKEWDRGHEAAMLFRFDNPQETCVKAAYAALKRAGFVRVWIVSTPTPKATDPVLIPSAR